MDKKNIVILIYMTLECNIRCYYCVVNFKKEYIKLNTIDDIINFIKTNRANFDNVSVEFFGGEPLLVFDKIKYFVENSLDLDIKYKITTNGILINKKIIDFFNKYFSSIYISFSNLSLKNIKDLYKIFLYIGDENLYKYAITFIYHPDYCFKEHIKYLKQVINIGYKNINILPIYMYKNYSLDEFSNLEIFLKYTKTIGSINFDYFYFIENKIDLEFSILPSGYCTLDSGETIYDMKHFLDKDIELGYINDLDSLFLVDKIINFNLNHYMKTFLDTGLVKQNYSNFMKLSDLIKSYS